LKPSRFSCGAQRGVPAPGPSPAIRSVFAPFLLLLFTSSLGISHVQSFAEDCPAHATAIYWNTLLVSGLTVGPAVGLIAAVKSFQSVIQMSSLVAIAAALILGLGIGHAHRTVA